MSHRFEFFNPKGVFVAKQQTWGEQKDGKTPDESIVDWLKAGRCPECMFTFAACECGPMIQAVLRLAEKATRGGCKDV